MLNLILYSGISLTLLFAVLSLNHLRVPSIGKTICLYLNVLTIVFNVINIIIVGSMMYLAKGYLSFENAVYLLSKIY